MGAYEYGSGIQDLLIGDLNDDGLLNVLDIVMLIGQILNNSGEYNPLADINNDSLVNVVDVVMLVDWILNS